MYSLTLIRCRKDNLVTYGFEAHLAYYVLNSSVLKKAKTNREYNLIYKHDENDYCYVCQRRGGNFYASCSPGYLHARGIHGSGKRIYRHKAREFKTWKYNRKKQWK